MSKSAQQFITSKDLESYAQDLIEETANLSNGIQHLLGDYRLSGGPYAQLVHAKKLLHRTTESLVACQHLARLENIK